MPRYLIDGYRGLDAPSPLSASRDHWDRSPGLGHVMDSGVGVHPVAAPTVAKREDSVAGARRAVDYHGEIKATRRLTAPRRSGSGPRAGHSRSANPGVSLRLLFPRGTQIKIFSNCHTLISLLRSILLFTSNASLAISRHATGPFSSRSETCRLSVAGVMLMRRNR